MTDKPKTITFTLTEPVEVNGTTYTELTIGRRKAKHMVAMDAVHGEARKSLAMYAAMANVPLAVLEELDAEDFDRLVQEALPLMGESVRRAMEERLHRGATTASA